MTDNLIQKQLSLLPENLKQEVLDFIGYLLAKYYTPQKATIRPQFGSAKGKYILAPDFDEPLDDFKDYM
jgi:Protein of unknown function (DUF2281)